MKYENIQLRYPDTVFQEAYIFGKYIYNQVIPDSYLPRHSHDNHIEICFLESGMQVYEVDNKYYMLTGGDVFFTLPYELHGTGGYPCDKSTLYWLQFLSPCNLEHLLLKDRFAQNSYEFQKHICNKKYMGMDCYIIKEIFNDFLCLTNRHFKANDRVKRAVKRFDTGFFEVGKLKEYEALALILELFLSVIECSQISKHISNNMDLTNCLSYIDEHIYDYISIADLACVSGLSESYFQAKFKKYIGIPPNEYIVRKKIDLATTLLKSGNNITTVSNELGFSTSQYFSNVYRKYTGMLPSKVKQ